MPNASPHLSIVVEPNAGFNFAIALRMRNRWPTPDANVLQHLIIDLAEQIKIDVVGLAPHSI
jgi:hypothetical protein